MHRFNAQRQKKTETEKRQIQIHTRLFRRWGYYCCGSEELCVAGFTIALCTVQSDLLISLSGCVFGACLLVLVSSSCLVPAGV